MSIYQATALPSNHNQVQKVTLVNADNYERTTKMKATTASGTIHRNISKLTQKLTL